MTTSRILRSLAGLTCLALASLGAAETLTVVSWGGSYEQASRKAIFEPFSRETGIEIRVEVYNGGLAQVRAQVETGRVYWDLVDLEMADAARGCDEDLLEYVDVDELAPAPDGTRAAEDFFEGTVIDCGGGHLFYSTIFAYNLDSFPGDKPSTIDDFFDLDRFPGRRGMRRAPQVNLEFALLADGVPADEVYDTLGTQAGMNRAFRKLDTIKEHIVWWEAGAQPPQMLADREVVMSTAYNGRIFNAQVAESQPFVVVWDGQVLDSGIIGIVAGSPNLETARRFVQYATRTEVQAAVGRYISYSPARHSGTDLISTHLETGVDMHPHMPTSPQNLTRVLYNDWAWWSDYGDDVNERFSAWLAR